jgi:hypothetical protein
MAKKQIRNKRVSRRALLVLVGLIILAAMIGAQVAFNIYINLRVNQLSVFQTRTLIVDAIDKITDLKSTPDATHRIPEERLQLPVPNESIGKVVYYYEKAEGSTPATIQITTRGLTDLATGQLNALTVDELFKLVPETQACSRGFYIRFAGDQKDPPGDIYDVTLAGTKQLADGRTMSLWRESNCGSSDQPNTGAYTRYEVMKEVEGYLLGAQSY